MFCLLRRSCFFNHGICSVRASQTHELNLCVRGLSPISTTSKLQEVEDSSFMVSYLMSTCGLPLKSALSISSYLHFDAPHRPDSVINLLNSHGFTQTQISKIIRTTPRVLTLNPEKVLLPKIQFFQSKGFLGLDLVQILQRNPDTLQRSLEKFIVPNYNYARKLLQSNEKTIAFLKRGTRLFQCNLVSVMPPKIRILQEIGVSDDRIAYAFRFNPELFVRNLNHLKTLVEKLIGIGFDPRKSHFVLAMIVMNGMSKCTWEKKVEVYKRWGWTSEEVLEAFKRQPSCMSKAEDKIMGIMDIVVNKMGWESSQVVRNPRVFTASLENTIKPRVRVLQFLLTKGLIKKNPSLSSTVAFTEQRFLEKYVHCYKEGPQLLKLYRDSGRCS